MPEFILDTAGVVSVDTRVSEGRVPGTAYPFVITAWRDLDDFTQGYIEAMFFTSCDPAGQHDEAAWNPETDCSLPSDVTFSDLAPETLARIVADCAAFQEGSAWTTCRAAWSEMTDHEARLAGFARGGGVDDAQGGRDFWFTRNGHGCGFWDGDWPKPHATALTDAAKSFGEVDAYLGDDGKVYL